MRIVFIAPWYYTYYPIICDSLLAQTEHDWHLLLIHDGPVQQPERLSLVHKDARIQFVEMPHRHNDYGHSLRMWAISNLESLVSPWPNDLIVHTNCDNYYVPSFCCEIRRAINDKQGVYCDCLHSHHHWQLIRAELIRGRIDCGCMAVRRELAVHVGWRSQTYAADWDWIVDMLAVCGPQGFAHLPLPLFVHN